MSDFDAGAIEMSDFSVSSFLVRAAEVYVELMGKNRNEVANFKIVKTMIKRIDQREGKNVQSGFVYFCIATMIKDYDFTLKLANILLLYICPIWKFGV
jgi:hypothetical protein